MPCQAKWECTKHQCSNKLLVVQFTEVLAQCAMVWVSFGHNGIVFCPKISTSWNKIAPSGRHIFATLWQSKGLFFVVVESLIIFICDKYVPNKIPSFCFVQHWKPIQTESEKTRYVCCCTRNLCCWQYSSVVENIFVLLTTYRVIFLTVPPKKLKYVKPRLGVSTLT